MELVGGPKLFPVSYPHFFCLYTVEEDTGLPISACQFSTILLYNSFGLIYKAAEDVALKAVKIHVFDYPTVV